MIFDSSKFNTIFSLCKITKLWELAKRTLEKNGFALAKFADFF